MSWSRFTITCLSLANNLSGEKGGARPTGNSGDGVLGDGRCHCGLLDLLETVVAVGGRMVHLLVDLGLELSCFLVLL